MPQQNNWRTCTLLFVWIFIACATLDMILGAIVFIFGFSISMIVMLAVPWFLGFFKVREGLRRRIAWSLIAVFSVTIFLYTNKHSANRDAVRLALAGHLPSAMTNFQVWESNFQDETIRAYFQSDPASLRQILEQPPFKLVKPLIENGIDQNSFQFAHAISLSNATLDFKDAPWLNLRDLPPVSPYLLYMRTDMPKSGSGDGIGECLVYTDPSYSFAYIEYDWMDFDPSLEHSNK